jgi:hypothetical protein
MDNIRQVTFKVKMFISTCKHVSIQLSNKENHFVPGIEISAVVNITNDNSNIDRILVHTEHLNMQIQ